MPRNLVSDWTVRDVTDSDHNVVSYSLRLRDCVARGLVTHQFNTIKTYWDAFVRNLWVLKPTIDGSTVDTYACTIVSAIQETARKAIPQLRRLGSHTSKQPWWAVLIE